MPFPYKIGKQPARHDCRTLSLFSYGKKLQSAPYACDLTGKITKLSMMANDVLGDCTCATVGHIIQQWTAENGNQIILSDQQIIDLYGKVGGYVPGNVATDNGANILDVLNYWRRNPVVGNALNAYVCINHSDGQQVTNSIYYFGNLYVGLQLPILAQQQDIWDVSHLGPTGAAAVGSWGGHAVPIVAYDKYHLTCITWGAYKKMTWNFYRTYCDEAYALLSPDWFDQSTGKCPVGFNLDQLQADLSML